MDEAGRDRFLETLNQTSLAGDVGHVTETVAGRLGKEIRLFGAHLTGLEGKPGIAIACDAFLRIAVEQAIALKTLTDDPVALIYVHRPSGRLGHFGESEADRDACVDRARSAGIEVISIGPWTGARSLRDMRVLRRELKRCTVGKVVVHAHYDPRLTLLALLVPTLLFIHDPSPHTGDVESEMSTGKALVARASETFAAVIALHSERLVRQLRPGLRDKQRVIIPHGTSVRSAPLAVPERRRCLLVGRMLGYKGVDVALNAFSQVSAARPDCELFVAGKGPVLDAFSASGNLDHVVVSRGYVDERDLWELFATASLVLLPYRDATQSGVGLQALGLGVPCLVSNVGALPDLVPASLPELICEPGNEDQLAAAILATIDFEVEQREQVLALARRYSWDQIALQIRDALGAVH